ncbi:MAG: uracil-DNA glycosylase [Actinomycetes bacterium]
MVASPIKNLSQLENAICNCKKCPRLVKWTKDVAKEKRKSYENEVYWGKPVPGFGDKKPKLLVVGLAPGAHGANRTGRIFTGDRSGEWLFRAMHKAGFANQAQSINKKDGLKLTQARVITAVRCAPPDNKPTIKERDTCNKWMDLEWKFIEKDLKVVIALGSFAWKAAIDILFEQGFIPKNKVKFSHGAKCVYLKQNQQITLLGSYHPSQQNTFTGRLTEAMLDQVFGTASKLIST